MSNDTCAYCDLVNCGYEDPADACGRRLLSRKDAEISYLNAEITRKDQEHAEEIEKVREEYEHAWCVDCPAAYDAAERDDSLAPVVEHLKEGHSGRPILSRSVHVAALHNAIYRHVEELRKAREEAAHEAIVYAIGRMHRDGWMDCNDVHTTSCFRLTDGLLAYRLSSTPNEQ